jgi:adenylosuccinate synthase
LNRNSILIFHIGANRMAIRFNGQAVVVVGAQWGDEGKGRIVDSLAHECDAVVRFHGGNNAGHSLHIQDQRVVLHLIPCGIMRQNRLCIIGSGVVIDPSILFLEMDKLSSLGIKVSENNLKIAYNAHVIFPFHRSIDANREGHGYVGTTKRGIGPCYEDKIARIGIAVHDLLSEEVLVTKLKRGLVHRPLKELSNNFDEFVAKALWYGQKIAPYMDDTGAIINQLLEQKKRVLFEGAQGTLLDVDHGSYPFVTASNCVAAQAAIGSGIGPKWLSDIFMVSKAYTTRVGEGPFFSEASNDVAAVLREKGNEYGATTGRPRRCGYLDLVALKYAARLNGAHGLILTKIDVLVGLGNIRVCVAYKDAKERNISFPMAVQLEQQKEIVSPVYQELESVDSMPSDIQSIKELPKPFQNLCSLIEKEINVPVMMVSYGPKRGQEFFPDGIRT